MPIYINALVSPDGKAAAVIADFKQDASTPNFISLNKDLHALLDRERDDTVDLYLGGLPMVGEAADREFLKMPMFFGAALAHHHARPVLVVPQPAGNAPAAADRHPERDLEPRADGPAGRPPRSAEHDDAHPGPGGGVGPRDSDPQALLRGILAADRDGATRRTTPIARGGRIDRARRAGDDGGRADRRLTFFSLVGTGIPMVQHFGVFAGCGVLATMIIEMTVIPAVRTMLRPPKRHESERERKAGVLDRFLTGVADALVGGRAPARRQRRARSPRVRRRRRVRLRIDNNFKLYHRPDSEIRVHDKVLNTTFGGTNSLQFLIQTPEADGIKDPRVLQGMARLQAFLESQPDVGKTQSLVDLIKRMNQAMHGDDPAQYTIPETRDLVAQYLFLYSLSGDPQDFDSLVDNDYQRAAVWTFVKNDSTTSADILAKRARAIIDESFPPGVTVQMGGSLPQLIALNDVIVQDKFRNMAQMALVVFVLGAIVLRSFVGGLFVVTPLFAVMLANFGVMGWRNTPLDITAMTTAAMAIGIGADYEIYLLFRFKEELARTGSVLAATRDVDVDLRQGDPVRGDRDHRRLRRPASLDFAFYNTISSMVMATMPISAFFALFFLRALMMIFRPRFVFGENRDMLVGQVAGTQGGGR